jgi:hypothetical protein
MYLRAKYVAKQVAEKGPEHFLGEDGRILFSKDDENDG